MAERLQDFYGPNEGYVLELYDRYRQDPNAVDAATRAFFQHWTPPPTDGVAPVTATPAARTDAGRGRRARTRARRERRCMRVFLLFVVPGVLPPGRRCGVTPTVQPITKKVNLHRGVDRKRSRETPF